MQTTPATRSTQSTTLYVEKTTKTKLSPADFLKLCFISQIGCDFSHNEIISSTTTTTITTTTAQTTTKRRVDKISSERQEMLRRRLQLCFHTGVCGDGDVPPQPSGDEEDRRVTTETPPTSTLTVRDAEIKRKVQERARACFYEGKCN